MLWIRPQIFRRTVMYDSRVVINSMPQSAEVNHFRPSLEGKVWGACSHSYRQYIEHQQTLPVPGMEWGKTATKLTLLSSPSSFPFLPPVSPSSISAPPCASQPPRRYRRRWNKMARFIKQLLTFIILQMTYLNPLGSLNFLHRSKYTRDEYQKYVTVVSYRP